MYKKSLLTLAVFLFVQVCFADVYTSIQDAQDKILSLIDAGDYSSAELAVDKMAADFAGNELLARRLWEDANRYDKVEAFEYAKALSAKVAVDYPTDTYAATYASLLLAKLRIYELIDAGNYEATDSAVSKMIDDFAGHKQLPRRLWEVANRYGMFKAFEYAKALSARIVADYPTDIYATYASLLLAKLRVYELIDAGNYKAADLAVSGIINNFAGHKQLSKRLYEIAHQYAKNGARTYANQLYGRITANWPNDKYGSRAAFQYKMEIYSMLDDSKIAIDKLITGFEDNPYLHEAISEITEECYNDYYNKGQTLIDGSQPGNKALRTVTEGLEYYVQNRGSHNKNKDAYMYYIVGGNFDLLGEYQKAVQYLTKTMDTDPDFEKASKCLFGVGRCYEKMAKNGDMPEDQALDAARKCYLQMLEKYPDEPEKQYITRWLKEH